MSTIKVEFRELRRYAQNDRGAFMFYDRFIELCSQKGVKPTRAALDAKISKSLVSKWKNNVSEIPSMEVLEKLSKYFNIPVSALLTEGLIRCHECGLLYDSDDPEEREHHRVLHTAREKAISHFGFCWPSEYRDEKKAESRAIVNDENKSIADRIDAQIIVFKALFSRSLMQNNFDLDHPDFNSYVAMILGQGPGKHSIPEELYDPLVYKYGTKEGIAAGTIYHKRNPPASVSTSRGNPVFDLLTDNEFLLVLDYAQRLIDARPKQ